MPPEPNNEKISQWLIEKQREEFKREQEKDRLAQYHRLDTEESRLHEGIRRQEDLLGKAAIELEEAEAEFQAASQRLDAARRQHDLTRFEFADLRSQLDAIQEKRKRLSPPELIGFVDELWKQFDQLRLRTVSYERVREMPVTGARTAFHLSNGRAIQEGLQTIRAIIDEAEGLRLLPLTDGEIEARLSKLKSRMPDIAETASQEERVDIPTPLPLNESPVRYA